MIEVELPDGTILEIETDDPNVAAEAGRKYLAGPGQPSATAEPGMARSLMVGSQGVGRGLADMFGMIPDLLNATLNAGGDVAEYGVNSLFGDDTLYIPNLPSTSESLATVAGNAARGVGVPMVSEEDMSGGERLAYNVNRFGTSAAGTGAGLARSALGAAAAGEAAPVPGLTKPYAAAAQGTESLARPLAADAAAGVGAGAATTAVEDTDSPIMKLLAPLLGAFAGSTGASAAAAPMRTWDAGRYVLGEDAKIPMDPETGRTTSRLVADDARRKVQGNAIDPQAAAANVKQGAEFYRDADMPVPTSGLLSNDEGVLAVERGRRATNPAEFARQDRQVAGAAAQKIDSIAPDGRPRAATDQAQALADAQINPRKEAVALGKERVASAEELEAEVGSEVFARGRGKDAASKSLDNAVVGDTLKPMQAKRQELRDAIPDDAELDATPLVTAIREGRSGGSGLTAPPLTGINEASLLDEQGQAGTITTGRLKELRVELADSLAKANAAGDVPAAKSIKRVQQAVAEMEQTVPQARDARQFETDEFGPKFRQGEGGRLRDDLNKDDLARSATPPTATAGRFLKPGAGGEEVAADLVRILQGSPAGPAGQQAARDYLLADMASTVGSDNKVNAHSLRRYIDDRQGVWQALPQVRAEADAMLRDVVNQRTATTNLQNELEAATAALNRTETEVNKSALGLVLGKDPANAVAAVFGAGDSERAMANITRQLGQNPEAAAGWKRAVVDRVDAMVSNASTETTSSGLNPVSLAKIDKVLNRYDRTLAAAGFTPQEMSALQQARTAARDLSRRLVSASGPQSTTAETLARVLDTVEMGVKAPVLGFGAIAGASVMRGVRMAMDRVPGLNVEGQASKLIHRMMFDPELAVTLLSTPTTAPQLKSWTSRVQYLLGTQQAAVESTDAEP